MSRLEPFIFEWQRYSPTTTFLIRNRPIFFEGFEGLRIFLGMRQAWRFQWDYSRVLNRSEKKMVQGFVRWIVFSKNRLKKMVFLVLRRGSGQKRPKKPSTLEFLTPLVTVWCYEDVRGTVGISRISSFREKYAILQICENGRLGKNHQKTTTLLFSSITKTPKPQYPGSAARLSGR